MSSESPAVILYSSDGYELATISGSAIPANTRGLLVEGSDGTNGRFLTVDTSGRVVIVGAAASGAAAAGNPLYTAGLATTAAPSYSNNTVNPLSLDANGNLRVVSSGVTTANVDGYVTTAAPTYTTGTFNALSLDTAGNLRVTGAGGTFPVTGTVTATNSANSNTGAAPPTQATYVGALVTTAAESGLVNGDMYPFNLTTTGQLRVDGVYPTASAIATAVDMGLVGGSVTTAAPTYTTATTNALSLDTSGNLRVLAVGAGVAGTPSGGVVSVQGAVGGTAIPVSGTVTIDKSSTGTMTTVAGATSSTTILASNANRVGASVFNDGSSMLYLALSATAASTTAFTIKVLPNSYYDLPVTYTGQINGIWNGTGSNARVTEWT